MKNSLLTTALTLLLLSNNVFAQEEIETEEPNRFVGLTAVIQQSQWGLQVPIWFSKSYYLAPSFAYLYSEGTGKEYSIGFNPRYYFNDEGVSPFIGARVNVIYKFPENPASDLENTADFVTGFGFGIDYFFEPKFSIGVEAQGNFTKSDEFSHRFGNPGGWNFNTAAVVSISVYY